MTLQATSPLRRVQTIQECMERYEAYRDRYDALLTLTETKADYWVKGIEEYRRLYPDAPRRRQDRTAIYIENSALYITDRQSLEKTNSVLGYKTNGYVIPEKEGIDINEMINILIAEQLLKDKQID